MPGRRDIKISIHVPREGHDTRITIFTSGKKTFQSTCPARGTTTTKCSRQRISLISIHVPREGHDVLDWSTDNPDCSISIHVPREGHDHRAVYKHGGNAISIHVPREGHDSHA